MILQKISKAIREQNYYAVALEFVIVIAGVVIGLQIQDWNEGRSNREREAATLARIQDELVQNILELQSRIISDNARVENHRIMVDTVTTGSIAPVNAEIFQTAVARIMFFSRPPISQPAYDALEQSGELTLIRDADLRLELNELRSVLDWVDSQHGSFRQGMSELAEYWRPYVFHHPTSDPRRTIVSINIEPFSADPEAVSALVEVARMHAIFASYVVLYESRARAVCEQLALVTGGTCPDEMEV